MDSILLYLNLEYRMSEIQVLKQTCPSTCPSSQADLSINLFRSFVWISAIFPVIILQKDGGNDYDFLLTFGDVKEAEEVVGDSGSGDVSDIIQVPSTLRSTIHTLVSNTEAGGLFLPDYPERYFQLN